MAGNTRNTSSPSRMRFLGRIKGSSTKSSARQFRLLEFSLATHSYKATRRTWPFRPSGKIAVTEKEISVLRRGDCTTAFQSRDRMRRISRRCQSQSCSPSALSFPRSQTFWFVHGPKLAAQPPRAFIFYPFACRHVFAFASHGRLPPNPFGSLPTRCPSIWLSVTRSGLPQAQQLTACRSGRDCAVTYPFWLLPPPPRTPSNSSPPVP